MTTDPTLELYQQTTGTGIRLRLSVWKARYPRLQTKTLESLFEAVRQMGVIHIDGFLELRP